MANILKYLFPVPKAESKRVITFANQVGSSTGGGMAVRALFAQQDGTARRGGAAPQRLA